MLDQGRYQHVNQPRKSKVHSLFLKFIKVVLHSCDHTEPYGHINKHINYHMDTQNSFRNYCLQKCLCWKKSDDYH